MIGAIIGDIVGSRFEFNNTDDLNFELFTDECSFTDDSICTLAIAYALVSGISYEESLRFWCSSYPNPMGAYGGSFARWLASSNPKPYNSFGNGSAMRVSPVAWGLTIWTTCSVKLKKRLSLHTTTQRASKGLSPPHRPYSLPANTAKTPCLNQ